MKINDNVVIYDKHRKMYVCSVDWEHVIVVMTKKKEDAKVFEDSVKAEFFIKQHADCGMAFNSKDVVLEY